MSMSRRTAIKLIAGAAPAVAGVRAFGVAPQVAAPVPSAASVRKFVFDGVYSEMRISMKELGRESPADLSP